MYVEIGNDSAIEGFRDPTSDDPDLVRYRQAEGQRVTRFEIPEDVGLQEAFSAVTAALPLHMSDTGAPVWIESDSEGLQSLLMEHYSISKAKNKRPTNWGQEVGA